MALGSPHEKIRQLFLGNGLLLAAIGVACGLAIAIPMSRLLASLLFEISPIDPITYGAVSLILIAAALLATYIPTLRATRVDPVKALRAD